MKGPAMKQFLSTHRRALALAGVLAPLLAVFVYVGLRSGPLAPVPVTVVRVENQAVAPPQLGRGTVGARYPVELGPPGAGTAHETKANHRILVATDHDFTLAHVSSPWGSEGRHDAGDPP